ACRGVGRGEQALSPGRVRGATKAPPPPNERSPRRPGIRTTAPRRNGSAGTSACLPGPSQLILRREPPALLPKKVRRQDSSEALDRKGCISDILRIIGVNVRRKRAPSLCSFAIR